MSKGQKEAPMPEHTPHDTPDQPYWVEQAFKGISREEHLCLLAIMKNEWGWFSKDIEVEFIIDSAEDHPPRWFPEEVNGQSPSPEVRLRWFDDTFNTYRACLFGSIKNSDVNQTRHEAEHCLCQMYHVKQMGELGEP
jgi:hypothetical protein